MSFPIENDVTYIPAFLASLCMFPDIEDASWLSPPPQMAEVPPARKTDDFTKPGCVMVVGNALSFVSKSLHEACLVLARQTPGSNSAVLNGFLYVSTVMLQSVLDGIASTVQKVQPIQDYGDVYFRSYPFAHAEIHWVSQHQHAIAALTWKGRTFNQLANALKHEQAWIGGVGENPKPNGKYDIYDDQGTGFVYGLLLPVYNETRTMVQRLARDLDVAIPELLEL
jgi:hypothetical protein